MKKTLLVLLLTAILTLLLEQLLPWWGAMLAAALSAFVLGGKALPSFLGGFFGVGLVWLGYALFVHSYSGGILTERVAKLFSTSGGGLFAATFLTGALAGGFAALTAALFRGLVTHKP